MLYLATGESIDVLCRPEKVEGVKQRCVGRVQRGHVWFRGFSVALMQHRQYFLEVKHRSFALLGEGCSLTRTVLGDGEEEVRREQLGPCAHQLLCFTELSFFFFHTNWLVGFVAQVQKKHESHLGRKQRYATWDF